MNRPAILLSIASLTFAVLSALLYRELRHERAALLEMRAQFQELAKGTAAATPVATETETLPTTVTTVAAAEPTAITLSVASADRRQEALERYRGMMADPEFRAAMLAQHRQIVERRHPDLARDLHISPEQAEKLYQLLATQGMAEREFLLELDVQLPEDQMKPDPAIAEQRQRLYDARVHQYQDERQNLLGEDKYREWKDYQDSAVARVQMRQLRGQLADGTAPLQEGQYEQLVSLLTNEQERHREDMRMLQESLGDMDTLSPDGQYAYRTRRLELFEQSQARANEAASAYLNSEQLAQYRKLQRADLERERTQLRLWRARQNYKAGQGG